LKSIILNKYGENFAAAPEGRIFHIEPFGEWDLSEYFYDENLKISKGVEYDSTFSFRVDYAEFRFEPNDILNEQLSADNLSKYLLGIRYYEDPYSSVSGEVIPDKTYFDEYEDMWVISIRGWLKYHLDKIQEIFLNQTFSDLSDFLRNTFLGELRPFGITERFSIIQNVVVEVTNDGAWDIDDQEQLLWKGQNPNIPPFNQGNFLKTHTYSDLLLETQKHYGAYLFVDGDLNLRFIGSRYNTGGYATPFENTTDISEIIYDDSLIQRPFKPQDYDGILISQKRQLSEILTEISWRMLRYVKGEVEETVILSEEQIQDLPENLKLIDLRQNLGWQIKNGASDPTLVWDGAGSAYEKIIDLGYKIFPQRPIEETLKDYELLLKPLEYWDCETDITALEVLQEVKADNILFQLFEFTEDRNADQLSLVLRRPANINGA